MPFQLILEQPLVGLAWVLAILLALAIHEFSHAAVGTLLGDQTAVNAGRLTINPLAHVDGLGFLMLLFVGFGWGKPVPFNPSQLKYRTWGPSLVALAGPASNLIGLIFSGVLLSWLSSTFALGSNNLLIMFLVFLFQINLVLMIFNLIPIPPLDGSKLLLSALDHPRHERIRFFLETRGPMLLLGLIIVDQFMGGIIFGRLFFMVMNSITHLFFGA
jgi:Zn-dependent protease